MAYGPVHMIQYHLTPEVICPSLLLQLLSQEKASGTLLANKAPLSEHVWTIDMLLIPYAQHSNLLMHFICEREFIMIKALVTYKNCVYSYVHAHTHAI